jgi:hypothetical protein
MFILNQKIIVSANVHIKDILMLWRRNRFYFICSLVKAPYYVGEDKKISKRKDSHMAFVKDKNNNITGMRHTGKRCRLNS